MTRRAKLILTAAALIGGLTATPALAGGGDSGRRTDESSPYIVGAWKFDPNGTSTVDSEFRFINPTSLGLTLEYAFFELDGTTFCGCDRDDFPPNKTTVYTMFQEANLGPGPAGPPVFSCTGTNGALKSIVFQTDWSGNIVLDDASQVGFQTHVFGVDPESDPSMAAGLNLQGRVMTEAGMEAISLNKATKAEIQAIHDLCVTVNGPISPSGWKTDPHSRRRGR
jgi:hypothetical protein